MSLVVGQLVRPVVGVWREMALGVVSDVQPAPGAARRTLIKVSFLTAELKEYSWYLPEHLEIIVE